MDSTPSLTPVLLAESGAPDEIWSIGQAGPDFMRDGEYRVLLTALAEAAGVFARHGGALSAGDLRTRSLVRLAAKEAQRCLLETGARHRREETAAAMDKESREAPGTPSLLRL